MRLVPTEASGRERRGLRAHATAACHLLDEYHVQAGCCEHWRCNNATLRCEPLMDSAVASAAAGAALSVELLASAALLM